MNLDPLKPYINLIRAALLVGLVVAAFVTGCSHGAAAKADELGQVVAEKGARIAQLELSLTSNTQALAEVESRSQAALADADRKRQLGDVAAEAARRGEAAAQKRAADVEGKWAEAARRKPACAALLQTNMEAVCGLSLR